MSIAHFRADLLSCDGPQLTYRFLPDVVSREDVSGTFVVNVKTGAYEILQASGLGTTESGASVDLKCVSALVYKLSKSKNEAPARLYFTA